MGARAVRQSNRTFVGIPLWASERPRRPPQPRVFIVWVGSNEMTLTPQASAAFAGRNGVTPSGSSSNDLGTVELALILVFLGLTSASYLTEGR